MPKSGTHYLFEIFKLLGVPPANPTILYHQLREILPHLPNLKAVNQHNLQKLSLEAIKAVNVGEVTMGHLPPTEIYLEALKEFKLIFLKRDLRNIFVSLARWFVEREDKTLNKNQIFHNYIEDYKPDMELYESLLPWNNKIYTVCYEDIISISTGAKVIQGLCDHLKLPCENPRRIIETALNTNTVTYNKIKTRKELYWTEEAEKWFVANGGPELNKSLGYEDG